MLEVLDQQLSDQLYICGEYSIADMATWPWVNIYEWSGISIDGLDNLQAWLARVGERPAVIRGSNAPTREVKREEDVVASSIRTMLA